VRASSDHRLYNTRGVIPTRTYGFNFRGRRTRTDRRIFFACVSAPRVSATKRESFANRAVRFPSFCWTGISVQRATDSGRRRIGRYGRCTRVVPVESKSTYVFGHFPNLFNDNARPCRLFYEIIFAVFPRASFYGSLFSTYARTNHVFDIYVRRPLRFRKIPVVINPLYRNSSTFVDTGCNGISICGNVFGVCSNRCFAALCSIRSESVSCKRDRQSRKPNEIPRKQLGRVRTKNAQARYGVGATIRAPSAIVRLGSCPTFSPNRIKNFIKIKYPVRSTVSVCDANSVWTIPSKSKRNQEKTIRNVRNVWGAVVYINVSVRIYIYIYVRCKWIKVAQKDLRQSRLFRF